MTKLRASVLATYRFPDCGLTANPKLTVPRCGKYWDTVRLVAPIAATSLSGIWYLMTLVQARSEASTMSPTCGGTGKAGLVGGGGAGAFKAGMIVVWLPDNANA